MTYKTLPQIKELISLGVTLTYFQAKPVEGGYQLWVLLSNSLVRVVTARGHIRVYSSLDTLYKDCVDIAPCDNIILGGA